MSHDPRLTTTHAHEPPQDFRLNVVVLGAILLAVFTVIALAICAGIFRGYSAAPFRTPSRAVDFGPSTEAEAHVRPVEPSLETDPTSTLQEVRRLERQRLETYRWIDRPAGVVAIPIERAMELLAAEGLPVEGAPPPPPKKKDGR